MRRNIARAVALLAVALAALVMVIAPPAGIPTAHAQTAPTISGTPPSGTVGQPYSFTFTRGGDPLPTVALFGAGSVPAGLTLSPDGVLSGIPTEAKSSTFSVRATNSVGTSPPLRSTMTINAANSPPTITGDPPDGTVGKNYIPAFQFTVGGFPAPTVTATGGSVPPGLTLSNTGRLSGTPTAAGTFTFNATAINGVAPTAVLPVTIVIADAVAPPTITGTPPSGTVGQPYSYTYTLTGDPAPTAAVTLGNPPPGLTLSPAGVLSGIPTTAGSTSFTITASNGNTGLPVTLRSTITINAVNSPPTITGDPPDGTVGKNYIPAFQFTVGGFPAPTVTATGGSVPPGLTLSNTGRLSGTPTAAGTFTFNATAINGVAPTAVLPVTIVIADAVVPPTITGDPPDGTIGQPYSYAFTLTGDPAPTAAVTLGNPPPGLTLSPEGVLSGTPTEAGNFAFTITASNGNTGLPVTLRPTITIAAVPTPPTILGTPPPGGIGKIYNYSFTVAGYPEPTVTASGGNGVPPGLTLSPAGRLSGTPTTAGTFNFTATADNGVSPAATLPVTIIIAADPTAPTISGTPPAANPRKAYSFAFTVTGDPDPIVTVSAGTLPEGLTLSEAGVLSGTPTTTGTSIFTVSANNGIGLFPATLVVNFEVANNAPARISGEPTNGTLRVPYTYQFEVTGFPVPTVTSTGTLPPGLTLSNTGRLSGTPTEAGTFDFTVTADNGGLRPATHATSVLIYAEVTPPPTVSGTPPPGDVGVRYSHTFILTGTPTPTVEVTLGNLPNGLRLSEDGVLSGTPRTAGEFTYTVTANNGSNRGGTLLVRQVINEPVSLSGNPPDGNIDAAYDYQFNVGGFPIPTVTSTGTLPPGLTLDKNGRLSGTPTQLGTFSFAVVASNLSGTADTLQVDLTINEPGVGGGGGSAEIFNSPGSTGSNGTGSTGPARKETPPDAPQRQTQPSWIDPLNSWLAEHGLPTIR